MSYNGLEIDMLGVGDAYCCQVSEGGVATAIPVEKI